MSEQQAMDLLEQGLNVANKAGAFSLKDAASLTAALNVVREQLENCKNCDNSESIEVETEEDK